MGKTFLNFFLNKMDKSNIDKNNETLKITFFTINNNNNNNTNKTQNFSYVNCVRAHFIETLCISFQF